MNTQTALVIERRELRNELARRLPPLERVTLSEAFTAMQHHYDESRVDNDGIDGLVLLAGVYDDAPRHFQFRLSRHVSFFSQLSITLFFRRGLRSLLSRNCTICCTERDESVQFFADVQASRVFRRFQQARAVKAVLDYEDEDDKPDEFYENFFTNMAPVFAAMSQSDGECQLTPADE